MKHPVTVTLLLVGLFVVAQLVGLALVNKSISAVDVAPSGQITLEHSQTALGDRPALSGYESFLYLVVAVVIGTSLLLLLIRFRQVRLWKAWFFLAVFAAQAMAFGVVVPQLIAIGLALLLAGLKIWWPNPWVHNITEIFMYAGIAVFLVPILDVFWTALLLLAISVYDAWAVWKSKHMVAMAEFQKSSAVFAGLMVPKAIVSPSGSPSEPSRSKLKASKSQTTSSASLQASAAKRPGRIPSSAVPSPAAHAILGGGDIAFPLLFAGVVMEGLIMAGLPRMAALGESLLITLGATLALALLFLFAKKDQYYPAMPFITAGCLLGWAVVLLL